MRGWTARLALGLLAAGAVVIQLFRPETPRAVLPGDGAMTDHLDVPERVERVLRTACYDCHSGETQWPWYSRIAPASWLIAQDVRHGRSNLDFSSWSTHPDREPTPSQRLRWICRDLREGTMPPRLYGWAHPEARLAPEQKDAICEWTDEALRGLTP